MKAVSQVDAVRKAAKSRKQSRHGEDEDDAFRAIEPEIDALFAMDEQLVWLCANYIPLLPNDCDASVWLHESHMFRGRFRIHCML